MELYIRNFLFRYAFILLSSLEGLYIFYKVFTPLTIYPVYLFYNLFYNASLIGTTIIFPSGEMIQLIFPCIAGSAYFLLFILNLSIQNTNPLRLLKMLLFSLGILLIFNILRIIFLGHLFLTNSSMFEPAHWVIWHLLSTIFVVLIWFAEVKLFKIKEIPFYTDFKHLLSKTK